MKKHTRAKTVNDPVIVTRVKNYLAENVDKTFVDVSQMARTLKERYREYNNKSDTAFCQMVESAYKVVLQNYGLDGATTSEGSEEESDLELLDENSSALNDRLLALYKMQDSNKRPLQGRPGPCPGSAPGTATGSATGAAAGTAAGTATGSGADKSGEPIDILSSDDENERKQPKLPKLSDQITITPHIQMAQMTPMAQMAQMTPMAQMAHMTQMAKMTHLANSTIVSASQAPKPPPKRKTDGSKGFSLKKKFDIPLNKSVRVSFEDIGGISEIINQLCDLILHMKHPEVYSKLGIKSPRGALLHGPPGTGKTLLAHAIAGKLQLPLIAVTGTELVGGVSGESEERIRDLFDSAASISPSVLFIDEIDAVCGNRVHAQKDMEKRMVAQLLASLDSLAQSSAPVLMLAATNNPDALDPALRRAGRLEQEITLGIPSMKSRKEILDILCKNLVLSKEVDMDALAQITPGFVGADLQALVNKASTNAVKRIFIGLRTSEIKTQEKEKLQNHLQNDVPAESNQQPTDIAEPAHEEPAVPANNIAAESGDIFKEGASEVIHEPVVTETNEKPNDEAVKKSNSMNEILHLLGDTTPYTPEQLSGLSISQEDFIQALKTTKPCAVREGIVTVPDVSWDDVGSLNQVRKELQLAVLAPVKYPEQLKKLGLSSPSGVLLCGPPGCGKTLLAKAVANEAGVNFISVKGPELLNMYVGESERAVRTCFRRARNSAPCVIFFDEFDALCPRRTSQDNNGAARVVNQLLTEMDGIESREGVFVLAASNRPDIIDPAVLRPGRLDRVMYVGLPARDDRLDILQKLTKGGQRPPLGPDVDLQVIARLTDSYTGADLAGLVRAAATISLTNHIENETQDGEIFVTFADFTSALVKCKPSVSTKEQLHYEKLRLKYASGPDDMEMETEATIEESMDTV